ncbi:uncharacterized protein LOC121373808 [Gigantopelta aegis]|uniref:uncharacterized protein LOC121373808 n=1 Tax=Gigantopelta aegis TaxID=1735272 RepID=UPI001B88BC4C|nr:uncharacterized protein LOC121373808 [Gigantopelta aegis]
MEVKTKLQKKRESVNRRTFNKWDFKDEFIILKMDDQGNITKLLCKICATHLTDIINEAHRRNMKGVVVDGIVKLASGVECIHKGNLCRHIKTGGLHDWAKKKYGMENIISPSPSTFSSAGEYATQTSIDTVIYTDTRTEYKHLFNTALFVARQEMSLAEFPRLIDLQSKNGMHFVTGRDCEKCCRQFVSFLATVLRGDIEMMMNRANFFSGFIDGPQSRTTGSEKELTYGKIVVNGCPTVLLLKCQDLSEIEGDDDAQCVKSVYDKTFLDVFNMPPERYAMLMVSVCTDRQNVYNTACKQLKQDHDREWLLINHCLNHHLELAIKDVFMSDAAFRDIDDMMMNIYHHFRNSGEATRIFVGTAFALGVICVTFVKAHGTHFPNLKYRACKAMLINYLPFCKYCEKMIEMKGACRADAEAELKDHLNKLMTYTFLTSVNFYRQVLRITTRLAYVMQNSSVLLTDVMDAMAEAIRHLNELAESEVDLPFEAKIGEDDSVMIYAKATNLPVTQAFREKHQLTEKIKKRVAQLTQVTKQEVRLKNVKQGQDSVKRIKDKLIPAVINAIDPRLVPFQSEEDIYNSVQLADHSTWDFDDNLFGMDKIKKLSEHFHVCLEFHGYNMSKAMSEFLQLKALIRQKYRNHINKLQVWKAIFVHFGGKFPHILLLIELCLSLAWSSSTVELGFNVCSRILTDGRATPKKGALDDLLMLRVNLPAMEALEPEYANDLVNKAVDLFLSKPRRQCGKPRNRAIVPEETKHNSGFLPTPFSASTNELLEDEDFLMLSDSSESDSESSDEYHNDMDADSQVSNDYVMEAEAQPTCDDEECPLTFKVEPAWD